MKNLWSKTRPPSNPYLTIRSGDWTWSVLKAYQSRSAELKNPYARWLCLVATPMTGPSGDMGDTYISSIPLDPAALSILSARLESELSTSKEAL